MTTPQYGYDYNKLQLETDGLTVGINQLRCENFGVSVGNNLVVGGTVNSANGWGGTTSLAGQLGGVPIAFTCESNGTGYVGQIMSFGSSVLTGKGIRMPFAGKIICATLNANGLKGMLAVTPALNGTVLLAPGIDVQDPFIPGVNVINLNNYWYVTSSNIPSSSSASLAGATQPIAGFNINDVGATFDIRNNPFTFNAGDQVSIQQIFAPNACTAFYVTFFVVYN